MSFLQAGHTSMPHLGTSVHPSLKQSSDQVKKVQASTAQRIFDTTMASPDMGMNERKAAFRVAATGLQGPKLTSEPQGGFTQMSSKYTTHTRIGASASSDGLEASVRPFETYFSGDAPRKTVGPTTQHTTLENPVYQTENGKVRSSIGSMSLARMDAEIQAGENKRRQHYEKLFPSNPDTLQTPRQTPVLSQIQIQTPPVPVASSLAQPLPRWKQVPVPNKPSGTVLTAIHQSANRAEHVLEEKQECLVENVYEKTLSNESKAPDFFGLGMNKQSLVISSAFSAIVVVLIIVIIVQSTTRR